MRIYRRGNWICGHHTVRNSALAANIQHNPHIFDAFCAQRTAGSQIAVLRFFVEKVLYDSCSQTFQGHFAQLRQDMLVQVVIVVLVATRLGYRLNINLQPLLRPLPVELYP